MDKKYKKPLRVTPLEVLQKEVFMKDNILPPDIQRISLNNKKYFLDERPKELIIPEKQKERKRYDNKRI